MDEQSLFVPKMTNASGLPWYDRSLIKDLIQFGPDYRDDFTLFLTYEAALVLREGTVQHAPFEAFGLLMGRAFADPEGCFTVVSNVAYAYDLKNYSREHIYLSPPEIYRLRQEALRAYPTSDFVGWTHSHSFYSEYSSVDLREQKTWTETHNVGILTFMDQVSGKGKKDLPWALAYRGPKSEKLPLSVDIFTLEEHSPALGSSSPEVHETIISSNNQVQLISGSGWLLRHSWLKNALLLLLLLLIVILGVLLGNFLFFHLPFFYS